MADELKQAFGESGRVLAELQFVRTSSIWSVDAPIPTFVDRIEPVGEVVRFAESVRTGPAVVVFNGLSGSGKSALLLQCAKELDSLFDVATRFDFGGAAADQVSPSDALGAVLQDLWFGAEAIPPDLRGRRSRFLSATAGRRILILLDGVTEAAQVTQLTPNSPHALVIAAGEFRLDALRADGARLLELDGLDSEYSLALLSQLIGEERVAAERDAALRIWEICSGLPLGLHVVAGRLYGRDDLSLDRVATEMSELHPTDEDWPRLTGVFASVYNSLDQPTSDVCRALGAAPGTRWPTDSILAMFDDPATTEAALRRLVRSNLLKPVPGGYSMPELAARYAADQAGSAGDPDLLDERRARMIRALAATAAEADRTISPQRLRIGTGVGVSPPFASPQEAMGWFSDWHSDILRVIRGAIAQGLDQEAWQLFESTWPFYTSRRLHQEFLAGATLAVEAAQRCGDRDAEARMRSFRSRAWMEVGDFEQATADLDAAAVLAEQTEHPTLRASVADFQGHVHYRREDYARAMECFELSERLHERAGDQRGVALQAQFRGRTLGKLDRPEEALSALHRAAELMAPYDDHRTQARIHFSRAEVLHAARRPDEAVRELNDALTEITPLGSTNLAIPPLTLLAQIAREGSDLTTERLTLQRLLEALPEVATLERTAVVDRLAELRQSTN